jgi:hypothetical protein
VARGENKPCVTGVGASLEAFKTAKQVSFDGSTGKIWLQAVPVSDGSSNPYLAKFRQRVIQHYGIVPAITDTPKEEIKSAVLYLGAVKLDSVMAAAKIAECAVKVENLYVDLNEENPAEVEYFSIAGGMEYNQAIVTELTRLYETFTDLGK